MSASLARREPVSVVLADETDFAGFRRAARALAAQGVPPEAVMWFTATDACNALFATQASVFAEPGKTAAVAVPATFVALCETVVQHDDPQRFALLYRLLWRLQHEPSLRHDPLDADVLLARQMARAVRRDQHKTTAFVRFRPLNDGSAGPLHVAWFEPSHHTVEAVAPFFMRRFANIRWAILTPRRSVRWEPASAALPEGRLVFGPGARKEDTPLADAGEALWLTYYANIFNPARLKLRMMEKEMPRKYWRNLPEAELIAPLAAAATERSGRMVAEAPTTPRRKVVTLARAPTPNGPAQTLEALNAMAQRCRECPIGEHATQAVVGQGPREPLLMFVGEQPGDQEDLRGQPFVGPAGQLFDRALAELGVARDTVYVANAVKHFKYEMRGKRRIHKTPAQREAAACAHWLEDEIRLVNPAALVALGATAARSLMGEAVAVTRERGQWQRRADGRPVLVTLHPSALLRADPAGHQQAWADWLADLRCALDPPKLLVRS